MTTCAERGYDVAISGRSERVHESATTLEKLGVEAVPFRADAATHDGVEAFWTFVADLDGELRTIAINCAGTVHLAERVVRATWGGAVSHIETGAPARRFYLCLQADHPGAGIPGAAW